jgi:CheY-specific phosphatase CheX
MTSINSLAIKEYITNAVREVFDTMLAMDVETVDEQSLPNHNGNRIVGSIGFAGLVMGHLNLHVGQVFARRMTAAMLGMETDEIEGNEEIHDVIGELCNMICGDLKSRLCDQGLTCELSIPSITSGKEFTIEPQGWARSERYGFRSNQDTALVEIYMKSGN